MVYFMKASELRIGNWVTKTVNNEECQIYANGIANLSSQEASVLGRKMFEPIPLTEEWLLEFRFKPHNGSFYKIAVGGSELLINPDNGVVWLERNDNGFNNPALIPYVHQLQNLYFALTGNELLTRNEL